VTASAPRRRSPARFLGPALLLLLAIAYAAFLHQGLGPRPEVPDSELDWWSPRGFLTNAILGSSKEWLLQRPNGLTVFGTPAALLLIALWASTRSALVRAAAVSTFFASLLFVSYALGSGVTQVAWTFFHWRASATMGAVAVVMGLIVSAPWLAASWLRLGWPARIAALVPVFAVVIAIERNVTGTNTALPFAISPWPAVQVFALETLGTTFAGQFAGLALALVGLRRLRRGRRLTGAFAVAVGLAVPVLAWIGLGDAGLLPFRISRERLIGADVFCAGLVAIGALGVRLDPARLRRRALHCAVAAAIVGLPLTVGAGWARIDYTETRNVRAQRIIDALARYYQREGVYPDDLEALVRAGLLDRVPKPMIGFALPDHPGASFTYEGFGTSYLLEFSAPRWVQCAYNPPYPEEEEGGASAPGAAAGEATRGGGEESGGETSGSDEGGDEGDEASGAWSCPAKPPELW
jgi:hypothetical protein